MKKYNVSFKMNGFQQTVTIEATSKANAEQSVEWAFTNATNIIVREA